MELVLLLPLMGVALVTLLLLFYINGRRGREHSSHNLPPGKLRGLPFIGEALPFLREHPTSSLGSYINQNIQRYGKIFQMSFLGEKTIVSVDSNFNKLVLMNEGTAFTGSIPKGMARIVGRRNLMETTGETHREIRSIIIGFLNARLRTRLMPQLDRQVVELLDSWKDRSGIISAQEEARKLSFNLIVEHTLSMEPGAPETEKLRKEYRTFTRGMATLHINIPGTSFNKALKSRSAILGLLENKIKQQAQMAKVKKDNGEDDEGDDFISILAKEMHLETELVLDLLLGFLLAGHETISTALALVIYFLNSCPKAIHQLREEHRSILNAKEGETQEPVGLTWEDYKKMDFTQNVINETLRLGNVVKFVYREAIVDVQYQGFVIPRGWKVIPILSSSHLDPTVHEDPQEFNPWRWERPSELRNKKNMLAFGGGARVCPGQELARLEMALFIHHLVLRYDWELAEPDRPICLSFVDFPLGLPIKVWPINSK